MSLESQIEKLNTTIDQLAKQLIRFENNTSALHKFEIDTVGLTKYISNLVNKADYSDELLTVQEIADRLKCNKNFVYELMKAGLLPFLSLGRKKVRKSALDEFIRKYEGWDISNPYNPKRIYGINSTE